MHILLLVTVILLNGCKEEGRKGTLFLDLSGEWRFQTDPTDTGMKSGWERSDFDDSKWRTLSVPGNWEAQGVTESYPEMPCPKLSQQLEERGVPNAYNGAAWYRRIVHIPPEWTGRNLDLFIGGIDDLDITYVNGREVGRLKEGTPNPSTVTRRYVIPSSFLNPDENAIAIRVWDGGGPGGIVRGPVVIFPEGQLARLVKEQKKETMRKMNLSGRFQSPPNDRRILKIVHGLPKDEKAQETLLLLLLVQGFGGIVTNVPFDKYLQDEANWRSFKHGVELARNMGMTVWLYDEKGYPSGTAGGLTLEGHPEWEALGLLAVSAEPVNGEVNVQLPEGPILFARAYPVDKGQLDLQRGVDLSTHVQGRALQWKAGTGPWQALVFVQENLFENTHASFNLFEARRYINLLMREPVQRFIQLTHQAYADRFPNFKNTFEAIFTDEPSLMSVFGGPEPTGADFPPIPWSPSFAQQFQKEKGYDLMPLLPALVADIGPQTGKVRCDFRDMVGRLVADGYFKQIQDWCHAHGIASSGHPLAEESLLCHCGYYGNFMACVRHLDFPSIDCLTSVPPSVPWHAAKLIGSVANIEGRPKTMSETSDHVQRYRRPGDKRPIYHVSPDEIRGTCNRLYVGGINTTTSYYSWSGIPDGEIKGINEYIGRIGTMLTDGEHVCDIAVYYPIESVWAHFVPSPVGLTRDSSAIRVDKLFRDVSYALFNARRDFDYVDADVLRRCSLEGDALRIGPLAFRVLILPCADTIPEDVWQKVSQFKDRGGVVIAVGEIPQNSTSAFPCDRVQRLSESVFGKVEASAETYAFHANAQKGVGVFLPDTHLPLLGEVCDALLEPDLAVADPKSPVRYTHRRLEGKDLYFIINDSARSIGEKITTCGVGNAEIWDPTTGKITQLPHSRSTLDAPRFTLPPYSSLFLVYEKCRRPERRDVSSLSGRLVITQAPFQEVFGRDFSLEPTAPAHVACETKVVQDPLRGGAPAAEIVSTIRQGDRDCWCFPRVTFNPPADLSNYRGIELQSYVPEGQSACGAQLSVILREEGGATYIANTGRSLAKPGRLVRCVFASGTETNPDRPA
jgi:hypothetical protein